MLIMASMEDPSFPLRLFVDKGRNHVVVAEASGDFVDTLFSFLTLPLGTIIRLISKNQQPSEIGCINILYQSVKDCDTQAFSNEICKQMLLCPRNPCEELCQKLKLNVDGTEPAKYWMCGSCGRDSNLLLSTIAGVRCSCGKVMDEEMKLHEEDSSTKTASTEGAFVKRNDLYLIFDDLKVLRSSLGNSIQQLTQLGYRDLNRLTQMSLNVGSKEVLDLLKRVLISKSPLSDVFLDVKDGGFKPTFSFTQDGGSKPTFSSTQDGGSKARFSFAQDGGSKPMFSFTQDGGSKPTFSFTQDRDFKPTFSFAQDGGSKPIFSFAQGEGSKLLRRRIQVRDRHNSKPFLHYRMPNHNHSS